MKATGIVRRIEECVIIGQKPKKPHKHRVSADFCGDQFAQYIVYYPIHSNSEAKFASLLLH